tara:strand:- start:8851 stop:8955 length:105 start_codon:yes stop_codon:yes gene_type:complete
MPPIKIESLLHPIKYKPILSLKEDLKKIESNKYN